MPSAKPDKGRLGRGDEHGDSRDPPLGWQLGDHFDADELRKHVAQDLRREQHRLERVAEGRVVLKGLDCEWLAVHVHAEVRTEGGGDGPGSPEQLAAARRWRGSVQGSGSRNW
jgi:hypothetical protein